MATLDCYMSAADVLGCVRPRSLNCLRLACPWFPQLPSPRMPLTLCMRAFQSRNERQAADAQADVPHDRRSTQCRTGEMTIAGNTEGVKLVHSPGVSLVVCRLVVAIQKMSSHPNRERVLHRHPPVPRSIRTSFSSSMPACECCSTTCVPVIAARQIGHPPHHRANPECTATSAQVVLLRKQAAGLAPKNLKPKVRLFRYSLHSHGNWGPEVPSSYCRKICLY